MAIATQPSPQFDDPPVVETVLGVQFDELEKFNSSHFGWFWKQFLNDDWERTQESPPVKDQFENFTESGSRSSGIRFQFRPKPITRMQFVHKGDDRVIQVQNTRLLTNWRKRGGDYPRFPERLEDFKRVLKRFGDFVDTADLGELRMNQWEVTYINHIPKHPLWSSPADWYRILPTILTGWAGFGDVRFESCAGDWHFEIQPQRGRLHVGLRHAFADLNEQTEVLALNLTARGPVEPEQQETELEQGLRLGHDAIVFGFAEMTSAEAHQHWNRRS